MKYVHNIIIMYIFHFHIGSTLMKNLRESSKFTIGFPATKCDFYASY